MTAPTEDLRRIYIAWQYLVSKRSSNDDDAFGDWCEI